MTKDIELKAIDELIYEIEIFEQAGVYPIHDFIDNLKTLAAKVKEETKLEGCVVVPVSELETCYYDEYEGMYLTNHDFLKNINAGEVVEVGRQYYWETTPLFAAITWDESNKKEGSFQLFNSHDEADKAASHCKEMLKAARGGNE